MDPASGGIDGTAPRTACSDVGSQGANDRSVIPPEVKVYHPAKKMVKRDTPPGPRKGLPFLVREGLFREGENPAGTGAERGWYCRER
ncbi:MAG: hypothetical protein D084_Lepto4C00150G0003 [Leptospirillum sp. Group IV 'UBA BS']|nr:MAG: hypothetical protein D084_Lepto4C00150G0003 [Leptospirillum sp. Group IV 'UBA BS']MCL5284595.1 hypothetical protein [Nitrospirota bacterium]